MFIEAPGGGGEQFYHRLPNGNFEEASNGNRKIWLMHDIQQKHEPKLGTATCSICGVWAINDSLRKAWVYK